MTVEQLQTTLPDIRLRAGSQFVWSPRQRVVYYDPTRVKQPHGLLALLHEIGHALLGHQTYEFDIELINMEVTAWAKARELAKRYRVTVDDEHVEKCLETYRIWLYKRSRCPECGNTSLQENARRYRCFSCGAAWQVSASKSLQPRRMNCIAPQ